MRSFGMLGAFALAPPPPQVLYNWLLTLAQPSTHAGASGRHSTVGATMAKVMNDQVPRSRERAR